MNRDELSPSAETVGAEPKSFISFVGIWRIGRFEKGKRSSVKWIRNTPTPSRVWHDLKVRIAVTRVEGYLDGKLYLEHTLAEPVSGRVGLWSKADSRVYFEGYTVAPSE